MSFNIKSKSIFINSSQFLSSILDGLVKNFGEFEVFEQRIR